MWRKVVLNRLSGSRDLMMGLIRLDPGGRID